MTQQSDSTPKRDDLYIYLSTLLEAGVSIDVVAKLGNDYVLSEAYLLSATTSQINMMMVATTLLRVTTDMNMSRYQQDRHAQEQAQRPLRPQIKQPWPFLPTKEEQDA